jgi:hypothetical protein
VNNDINKVKIIMISKILNKYNIYKLKKAIINNKLNEIKIILKDKNIDVSFEDNWAINNAVNNNSIEIVELLLEHSTFNALDNLLPLNIASTKGYVEIIKLFINDGRIITSSSNYSLLNSVENGHFDIVEILLKSKNIDPTHNENHAIELALKNKEYDIVGLLWNDTRVRKTLSKDFPELNDLLSTYQIKKKIKNTIKDF